MSSLSSRLPVAVLAATFLSFSNLSPGQESEESAGPASIPFADMGGIQDYRAESDSVLYVQGRNKQWYRAEIFGHCQGLRSRESLAFVTGPGGNLDRFGSVLVNGERCYFRSFEASEDPFDDKAEED